MKHFYEDLLAEIDSLISEFGNTILNVTLIILSIASAIFFIILLTLPLFLLLL
ncbi:MAG: hypothetical protein QXW35_03475 [Candidatus Aenigmatarchaeota archaeon]